MVLKAYVSRELTHIVGKGKPPEEQYESLLGILSSGQLLAEPARARQPYRGWITWNRPLGDCESHYFPRVCFCDIPLNALGIHVQKYGRFGLSFPKSLLVKKGASPVCYIAEESQIDCFRPADVEGFDWIPSTGCTRGSLLDGVHEHLREVIDGLLRTVQPRAGTPQDEQTRERDKRIRQLGYLVDYLDEHVFSFVKQFNSGLSEDHPENFYMEREWRVPGDLSFTLDNVSGIILPREYTSRFRDAFPNCQGPVYTPEPRDGGPEDRGGG